MTESTVFDDEFQIYFDYLINPHCIINEQFSILDADERPQYSAEELALEVV